MFSDKTLDFPDIVCLYMASKKFEGQQIDSKYKDSKIIETDKKRISDHPWTTIKKRRIILFMNDHWYVSYVLTVRQIFEDSYSL